MTEAGHSFLARLGKTRLRPGGKQATHWLFDHVDINPDKDILEVACNQCTNAIELVKKTGCSMIAVDLDPNVVEIAKQRVRDAGLTKSIQVERGNALNLSYPAQSFDIIINEAMLTMLGDKQKQKALSEYYRVLKPGGILLTHDVHLVDGTSNEIIKNLQQAIHVPANPYDKLGWTELFETAGFNELDTLTGPMSLLSPIGMIRDEGIFRTLKITRNAFKKDNYRYFKKMYRFFRENKASLGFIAVVAYKK
ncbi:methyltransferase domain-containing protein [Amphibacillus cookii]|uniref:methyltransferase domain-containing protein n=1 Tax=Amphibacillus cookii TaxID=767787 RepID=UPI001959157A|nr:ubiquinone/menaquinone biosynthesis C-methylase UbiE [Amphibacillus cookii]